MRVAYTVLCELGFQETEMVSAQAPHTVRSLPRTAAGVGLTYSVALFFCVLAISSCEPVRE